MYIVGRIVLGLVGLILLIVIIVKLFGGHSHKATPPPANKPTVMTLPDYATTDAAVSLTTDGIVNGDDLHRAIRVIVNSTTRELDIYQGYSSHVLTFQTFGNTLEAYTVFLKALNNRGFLTKTMATKSPANEQGQCPLGFRYILDLNQDNSDISRTWSSTCDTGTAGGDVASILELFQDQIPNYSTLTEQVNLSATSTQ